jgi:hypothetical protein
VKIFLSAVSGQFKDARDALASDLRAVGAEVVVQEDFQQHGRTLLEKLQNYIASCDRVIALVGDAYGWEPDDAGRPHDQPRRSYSQWEYFFAQGERLHGERQQAKDVFLYFASPEFLAAHPVEQDDTAGQLQRHFIATLRESGKDWNTFGSLDQLRALVLRDGFRLQRPGRADAIGAIGSAHNFQPATQEHPRLTAILKKRLRPLEERHNLFGGREAELAVIDRCLEEHTSGYVFITGRSGFGKTALLANWIKLLRRREEHVCYHFISRVDQTADEGFSLRNLCQQLASYHELTGELPADKEQLRILYADLLRLPPRSSDERLLVVLDGLDEAAGWIPASDMFPHELPPGVFVVFSAREIADRHWLREIELDGFVLERVELHAFDTRQIGMLLRAAEDKAQAWAGDETFIDVMHQKSRGDPFYLNCLVNDIQNGVIASKSDLDQQPTGLDAYLNKWWQEVSQVTGDQAVRDLIGYILVAKGPLTRDELVNISSDDKLDDWVFDATVRTVERHLLGDPRAGYTLAHQRFQDFVTTQKIKGPAQKPYRQCLLNYCRRWREHRSRYAFGHLAEHLADDHQIAELHALLAVGDERLEWAEARYEAEGSYDGYLRDLELARDASGTGAEAVGRQLHYMLIESSIRTLSANIPADLLMELTPDVWSPSRALAHVQHIPEDSNRVESLLAVARKLPAADMAKALSIALEVGDARARVDALVGLAPMLDADGQQEVLSELRAIPDESVRWPALSRLMPHLAPGHQRECLHTASAITNELDRSLFLIRASCLPTSLLEEVLTMAGTLENERLRIGTGVRLAVGLPSPFSSAAYSHIDEVTDRLTRLRAEADLASHLPRHLGLELVWQRLIAGDFTPSGSAALDFVLRLLPDGQQPQWSDDLKERITEAVSALSWSVPNDVAMSSVAILERCDALLRETVRLLDAESQSSVRALSAARLLTAHALLGNLDSLPEHLHATAIKEARAVENRQTRLRFLTNVMTLLDDSTSPGVIGTMLDELESIDEVDEQHQAAYTIANGLPERWREVALSKVGEMKSDIVAALVEDTLRRRWSQEGNELAGGHSSRDGPSRDLRALLLHLSERLPAESKELALKVTTELEAGSAPEDACVPLSEALPRLWLQSARGGTGPGLRMQRSFSFLSDELIDRSSMAAMSDPTVDAKTLDALRSAGQAIRDIQAIGKQGRTHAKAMTELVGCLPARLRRQVVERTLSATRAIGGPADHAQAFVNVVRYVDTARQDDAHTEAMSRLQAIEERKYGHGGYEDILLELIYQEPADAVPVCLGILKSEPDSWIRARILAYSAGALPVETHEIAAGILSDVDDNAIHMAMLAVPTLSDALKPVALARLRRTVEARQRADLFSDLTICLPEDLKRQAAQEALEAARLVNDGNRPFTLAHLAASLPEDQRNHVLELARGPADASSRAAALGMLVEFFADEERLEIIREVLGLLSEIPDSWQRDSVLRDVAPHLPEPMFDPALAAARAIPDPTYRAKSLCRLANHMTAPGRDNIYIEAFTIVEQMDEDLARVHGLIEISECLPAHERDEAANKAWQILRHPQNGPDDNARARVYALIRIVPYLPEAEAAGAAHLAVKILGKMPEEERSYPAQDLRRALDERSRTESDNQPRRPNVIEGPKYRLQRELLARQLVEQLRERSEQLGLAELHGILEAIESADESDDGYVLRQLLRLPCELAADALEELLRAAQSMRWSWKKPPVYLEIAQRLSDKEKARVLCLALTAHDDPVMKAQIGMFADNWRREDHGPDAGRLLVPALICDLAKQTRPVILRHLAVLAPVVAHLYGRKVSGEIFYALRDVTRWWP